MIAALVIVGSYLVGSIPVGLLMGLARGVDVRAHGSGNIGATNVARVLGRRAGLACFGLDFLKGFAPAVASGLALGTFGTWHPEVGAGTLWVGGAIAGVLGHVFPVWLRFKGGKGIATGLGAMLGVFPLLTFGVLMSVGVWIAAVAAWRMIGPASCLAAAALPVGVLGSFHGARLAGWNGSEGERSTMLLPLMAATTLVAVVAIVRHRANLARWWAGTEPRIGRKRAGADQ